jgi:tetratricopeptide (TPR) repeat protein
MNNINELLATNQFQKVIDILKDKNDINSLKYLIMAYFGLKDFEQTIILVDQALAIDESNYYFLIRYKLEALIDLGRDEIALSVVEQELKMPYIPKEYDEYFRLLFKNLNQKIKLLKKQAELLAITDADLVDKLNNTIDPEKLLVMIDLIGKRNARNMVNNLRTFFENSKIPPFVKLSLAEVLHDQAIDFNFKVLTDKETNTINPVKLTPLFNQTSFIVAKNLVEHSPFNFIASQKDIIYEVLIGYWASLFPQTVTNEQALAMVAACMIYSNELLGQTNKVESICHYTGASLAETKRLLNLIKQVI